MQVKSNEKRVCGNRGEDLASAYLSRRGFHVIERNFRTKCGEIDIIARRDREIHFIEVKARAAGSLIDPIEAVTFPKMRRIRRAAEYYIMRNPRFVRCPCSFGVIGIDFTKDPPHIECILDAFE